MGPVVCSNQRQQNLNHNKNKIENFEQIKSRLLKTIDNNSGDDQKLMSKLVCILEGHKNTLIKGVCINEQCLAAKRQFCEICLIQGLHNKDQNFRQQQDLIQESQLNNIIYQYQQIASYEFDAQKFMLYYEKLLYFNLNEFNTISNTNSELNQIEDLFTQFSKAITEINIEQYLAQMHTKNTCLFIYLKSNYQLLVVQEQLIRNQTKQRIKGSIIQSTPGVQSQREDQGKIKINKIELLVRLTKTQFYQNKRISNEQADLIQKHIDSIFSYGQDFFKQKQYQAALENFQMYLGFTPQNSNLHKFMGNTLRKLQKYNEAQYHLDLAIQLDPKSQIVYLLKGKLLFQIQQYEDSIKMFDSAINLSKQDYLSYFKKGLLILILGKILFKMKKFDDAKLIFDKAIQLNPQNHNHICFKEWPLENQTNYHKPKICLQQQQNQIKILKKPIVQMVPYFFLLIAQIFHTLQQYDQASQMYNEAIKLNPQKCSNYTNKGILQQYQGILFYNQTKYEEALEIFDKARIILSPDKYDKLVLCVIYQQKCQTQIKIKSQNIQRNQLNHEIKNSTIITVQFYMDLGQLLSSLSILEEKMIKYDQLTKLLQKNKFQLLQSPEISNNISFSLEFLEYQELQIFLRAIQDHPDYYQFYIQIGLQKMQIGMIYHHEYKFTEALEAYDDAIDVDSLNYLAFVEKGKTYIKLTQYDEAFEMFNQAILLEPKNYQSYHFKGNIYYLQQAYDNALILYDAAIELNSYDVQSYNNKGQTLSALNKDDSALEQFEKALKIDPENNQAYLNIGTYYYKQQKYNEALQMFDKAICLDVIDFQAYFKKGLTLSFLGKHQEAIQMYDIAIFLNPLDQEVKRNKALLQDILERNKFQPLK